MRPTRWVLSLVLGAGLGAAVGFALVWLLVAVAALEQSHEDASHPPHVVLVSTLLGTALLLVSARALATSSRAASWATALVLVPASLGWSLEPESEDWVPIGLATAVVLVLALLTLGLGRPAVPPSAPGRGPRALVALPVAAVLIGCLLVAGDQAVSAFGGALDLMLYYEEQESVLYAVLPPFVLGGVAAGLLRETLRRSPRRRESATEVVAAR